MDKLLHCPSPLHYALPLLPHRRFHVGFSLSFMQVERTQPDTSLTNIVLFPLDGLLRANSISHALALLSVPSVNPLLVSSPLFHFILGAAASAGGGLVGGTLSVWTPNWHLSTPPPLRTGVWGLWSTLDIWAGGLAAATYGTLTAHPAFLPLRASIASPETQPFSVSKAKAAAAAVMIFFFGLRVAAANMPSRASKPPMTSKQSGKKVKTQ
jgi:hypothetical protein